MKTAEFELEQVISLLDAIYEQATDESRELLSARGTRLLQELIQSDAEGLDLLQAELEHALHV